MIENMRNLLVADHIGKSIASQEGRQQVYAHHKKIVEAILNRDEKAAQDAMFLHLENVVQSMKKASPSKSK